MSSRPVRFIHTSDWQLGMRGGGLGGAAVRVAAARLAGVGRILALAESEGADFVLAAGDLFENNQVGAEVIDGLARALRDHPEVALHAIPGNHDLAGPGSVWTRPALSGLANLHVHTRAEPVALAGGAATLHPFPVASRYSGTDPLADAGELWDAAGIQIGMAHGHLKSLSFGAHETEIRLPIGPEHVARIGLDYLALGHWHGTRLVPGEHPDEIRIAYAGTHEQTAYRESDAGNALVVEIAAKGAVPVVRKVRVGALRWARRELAFAGDTNLERLRQLLAELDCDLARLELGGELPVALYDEYRDLIAGARAELADLRVRDDGLTWLSEDLAASCPTSDAGLAEVYRQLSERLAAATGDDAEVARRALRLLARSLREVGL